MGVTLGLPRALRLLPPPGGELGGLRLLFSPLTRSSQQEERPIRQILYLGELLETCHFQAFWVSVVLPFWCPEPGEPPQRERAPSLPPCLLGGTPVAAAL